MLVPRCGVRSCHELVGYSLGSLPHCPQSFCIAPSTQDEASGGTPESTTRATVHDRYEQDIALLEDLIAAARYQQRFNDPDWLDTFEKEAGGALHYDEGIQRYEHRVHSTSGPAPRTWDPSTRKFMHYRVRPKTLTSTRTVARE